MGWIDTISSWLSAPPEVTVPELRARMALPAEERQPLKAMVPLKPGGAMGQIDWGQMIGQGLDILGSIRGSRKSRPAYGPPSPGMMAGILGPEMALPGGVRGARPRKGEPGYRRRMNPLNARAARRAVRRLKSVRKLLHSIERQMPHRVSHARTRFGRK